MSLLPPSSNHHERSDWVSYLQLLCLQAQNAFNDKCAQFLLIPLAAWLTLQGESHEYMPHLLAVMLVAPYLLFAPVAGWVSDHVSKTSVVRLAVVFQTVVVGSILISALREDLGAMVWGFFALSIQSTFLGPAKRGAIKEYIGPTRLGIASGLLEMSVILAVCVGQIIAGYWFAAGEKAGGWPAVQGPMTFLFFGTLLPIVISWTMAKLPAQGGEGFQAKILIGHFRQLRLIWSDRTRRSCALGKAYFWGYGGFLNLVQIRMALELSQKTGQEYGSVLSTFMVAAGAGVIGGGVITSLLCARKIRLELLLPASLLMVVGPLFLAFAPLGSLFMYTGFVLSGLAGASFMVPLNAYLQDIIPASKRGNILAGASVLDCLMGLGAVALQGGLVALGVPIWGQCILLAVLTLWMIRYPWSLMSLSALRWVLAAFCKLLYRIKVSGLAHLPEKGGVLLTPNHVSYIDAIILSAACPRPVRFLMVQDCFEAPRIRWFAKLADTIPISPLRSKEALERAAKALKEGSVVCIFPEGQLTRSGMLCELKRGFALIAKMAQSPVVPVYMDGLWGSLFSYEGGSFFWKRPKKIPLGVRVCFGKPLPSSQVRNQELRPILEQLSVACFEQRRELRDPTWFERLARSRKTKSNLGNWEKQQCEQLRLLPEPSRKELLYNALQLREVGFFQKGMTVGIETTSPASLVLTLLALMLRWQIVPFEAKTEKRPPVNNQPFDLLFTSQPTLWLPVLAPQTILIDLSGQPVAPQNLTQAPPFFPFYLEGQRILAVSGPHFKKIKPTDFLQPGWKQGSPGRVLPATRSYQTLPLDEEGFIVTV